MTNPSKLEQVARAICIAEATERGQAAYAPGVDAWTALQRSSRRPYLAMARAAIAAMEVPTEQSPPSWGELQPRAALKEEK